MASDLSITRREMLRVAGGAMASLFAPALARGASSANGFDFLVVNDIHHNCCDPCRDWLESVVRSMRTLLAQPEFCVLAGDLAEHGRANEIEEVRAAFAALSIPIFAVIGNHDYLDDRDRGAYCRAFPRALNYSFEHRGWQFIGLDSTDHRRVFRTTVQRPTFAWLDENLRRLSREKPTAIFTHFPLGGTWVRPINAGAVLRRFRGTNLREVFTGHWHGFTACRIGQTTLTTNRCCARFRPNNDHTPEKGYFLCRAAGEKIERYFVEVAPADEDERRDEQAA